MSYYRPDPDAVPTGTDFTRQLSQRDLSLQVPLNYVTASGVVLRQACFAHDRYIDDAAAKCFSNLLALGFQRFELDIYWDASRTAWSLCPVQLGTPITTSNVTTRGIVSPHHNAFQDPGVRDIWNRNIRLEDDLGHDNVRRQDSTTTTTSPSEATGTSLTGSSLTLQTTPTLSTAIAPTPTAGVFEIGPYSCSPSTSFQAFVNILLLHLEESQTNVNATIKYLIMNLHAASPASDPTGTANQSPLGTLPQGKQALGYILDLSMAQFLYTPDDLALQRSDLNSSQSWFAVERFDEPDSAYFSVDSRGGDPYTPNGWPSASFVEMQRAKRLFVGFGSIEPQMEQYNFSADKPIIFPPNYLQSPITADPDIDGRHFCFFDPDDTSVSATNNSWALAWDERSLSQVFTAANNFTLCGISPVLNETLAGVTADEEFLPYRRFLQQTIWSWAPGEPQRGFGDTDSGHQHRCAVLNADTGYWETEDCSASHYSACSHGGRPYQWSIGGKSTGYNNAELPCPDGTGFTAPRTALENQYLVHRWREVKDERHIDDDYLWVNFNDLDVEGCWVIGQNVTCPYLNQGGDDREIIVPTIAAVIVFVLAALTVFVKCAANRQRSKRRRRRGDDGWDYEGVPS